MSILQYFESRDEKLLCLNRLNLELMYKCKKEYDKLPDNKKINKLEFTKNISKQLKKINRLVDKLAEQKGISYLDALRETYQTDEDIRAPYIITEPLQVFTWHWNNSEFNRFEKRTVTIWAGENHYDTPKSIDPFRHHVDYSPYYLWVFDPIDAEKHIKDHIGYFEDDLGIERSYR